MVPAHVKRTTNNKLLTTNYIRGFTLTELLVVIGVIGVLAGITFAAINPLTQFQKARDAQRKNDLANIQKALELYYNDNNRYPTLAEYKSSLAPTYIKTLPADKAPHVYLYEQESLGQAYQLYARLERCQPGNCQDNQACFPPPGPPAPGSQCGGVDGAGNCGTGITCTYGVSSSNTTPNDPI